MIQVEQAIHAASQALANTPFIRRLATSTGTKDHCRALAMHLTFWAMAFQDVIRLNAERTTSPILAPLVRQHYSEDRGHELWFWADAERLGAVQSPGWYFSAAHSAVRDVSHALISEVFRAKCDEERVALVLALEGGAGVFFPCVIGYFERSMGTKGLLYFANAHREVDSNHDLFQSPSEKTLTVLSLSASVRERASEAVARIFEQFGELARHLEDQLGRLDPPRSSDRAGMTRASGRSD